MAEPTELTLAVAPDAVGRWVVAGLDTTLTSAGYDAYFLRAVRSLNQVRTDDILIGAGEGIAWSALTTLLTERAAHTMAARITVAEQLFAWMGLGRLDLSGLTDRGGRVSVKQPHMPLAWRPAWGSAHEALCFFTQGWVAGAASAVLGRSLRDLHASHPACQATGSDRCWYVIAEGPGDTASFLPPPALPAGAPQRHLEVAQLKNRRGVIRLDDELIVRRPLAWNVRVGAELVRRLAAVGGNDARSRGEALLVEAAHYGAYHLFQHRMDSNSDPALRLQAGVALANQLGLGRFVIAHHSDEQLIVRLEGDRESALWRALYGDALHPVSWRARGVVQALADLQHVQEQRQLLRGYAACIARPDRFRASPLSSAAMGDGPTSWSLTRRR